MKNEIRKKLEKIALDCSTPFCYSCYQNAPTGNCLNCGSDDLMRHLKGVGVEYGTEWIINYILETELTPLDAEDAFEESVRQCYPENTIVGWMAFDTVDLMKSQDPISWKITQDEWITSEEENKNIVSFDNGFTYYLISNLEILFDQNQI